MTAELPPVRDFLARDVTEQLRVLREVERNPVARCVLSDAIKEIEYLRGVAFSIERGNKRFSDFWDDLREAARERGKRRRVA